MIEIPTRQDVLWEALSDPMLHQAIALWRCGDLTFEQALSVLVIAQANRLRELENDLLEANERRAT